MPFLQQVGDELFGCFRDGVERLVVEVVVGAGDVVERLGVVVPHERRETRQPAHGGGGADVMIVVTIEGYDCTDTMLIK